MKTRLRVKCEVARCSKGDDDIVGSNMSPYEFTVTSEIYLKILNCINSTSCTTYSYSQLVFQKFQTKDRNEAQTPQRTNANTEVLLPQAAITCFCTEGADASVI